VDDAGIVNASIACFNNYGNRISVVSTRLGIEKTTGTLVRGVERDPDRKSVSVLKRPFIAIPVERSGLRTWALH